LTRWRDSRDTSRQTLRRPQRRGYICRVYARGLAALQQIAVTVHQEPRAARPRNDFSSVSMTPAPSYLDADSGAHRLRNFIQLLGSRVRHRDVFESRLAPRRLHEPGGTSSRALPRPAWRHRPAAPAPLLRFRKQLRRSRHHLKRRRIERRVPTRASAPIRRDVRQRHVYAATGGDGVEVVAMVRTAK